MFARRSMKRDLHFEALDERVTPSHLGGGLHHFAAGVHHHVLARQAVQQSVRQANFGNLISALNNISAQIGNLNLLNQNNINAVVSLVNVQDVLNGNNIQAFNNALNRNLDNVHVLQDFLNNSLNNNNVNIIRNVLNNNNIAIGQVVALNVNVLSGQTTLFYLPTAV